MPSLVQFEACILAGGLSARLGRDKSNLRLGRRTLLGHIRSTTQSLGLPTRVIRRDLVPRCGPLGGIYTGLRFASADAVLFLACDMPFVSAAFLERLCARFSGTIQAVFVVENSAAGFPFILLRTALPDIEQQLAERDFSLQNLAARLHAKMCRPGRIYARQLLNINLPEDWETARRLFSVAVAAREFAAAQ